jgi:tRNA pseudouridine55 synthase
LDGIISILKPPGMTSSDVVVYLRRLLNIKKVGHTGTLDPGAAGVLPICVGKATRLSNFIMDQTKLYRCEMVLGIETDTFDSYGKVVSVSNKYPGFDIIKQVFSEFQGNIKQYPPMYSAIKHEGKKLYELARQGKKVEVLPRDIKILKNTILRYTPPNKILFEVECSKGTYVRALCRDMGQRMGCGGHMGFLLRCRTGKFNLNDSYTIDEVEQYKHTGDLDKILIPMDKAVETLEKIILPPQLYKRVIHGNLTKLNYQSITLQNLKTEVLIRVYCQDQFLGLGIIKCIGNDIGIQMKKVLV